MIYLDTHVVAWLYDGRVDLLPELARSLIEANDLRVSPMVGLELQYLYEIDRFAAPADLVLESLSREIQLAVRRSKAGIDESRRSFRCAGRSSM